MGREIKHVPVGFDWPLGEVWQGYVRPSSQSEDPCPDCEHGLSSYGEHLHDLWYGYTPFHPLVRLRPTTPVVRAYAERNVGHAPNLYGTGGEFAIVREAVRLADLWNDMWSHHLSQADVDALVAEGRLYDFTHTWDEAARWQPKDPPYHPTAAEVNEWSLTGLGHDSINAHIVIKARCEREGQPYLCSTCRGDGSLEAYPGQRAMAEVWQATEPPTGDGWQVWETVSEGSPITPVFATSEDLIDHLVTIGTTWDQRSGDGPWRRAAAEAFVRQGWAPTFVGFGGVPLEGGRDSDLMESGD